MQQDDRLRLEKLRGGAQERLIQEREGNVPLLLEAQRRLKREIAEEAKRAVAVGGPASAPAPTQTPAPTPYKDVLVGQTWMKQWFIIIFQLIWLCVYIFV